MKNLHKRSVVVENGHPKLPTSSQIEYGEIAVNYAAGYETLSIRNSEDGIATFSADSLIENKIESRISGITMNGTALTVSGGVVDLGVVLTEEEDLVISAALNDLNDRVAELSADTSNKQDTLISGTNIKTINNQSILGNGNITIEGGGTEYSAGTNIDITNHVISVTGLSSYELISNKATTITSASTHTEYASAKAVYDIVGDIDVALKTILTGTTS